MQKGRSRETNWIIASLFVGGNELGMGKNIFPNFIIFNLVMFISKVVLHCCVPCTGIPTVPK